MNRIHHSFQSVDDYLKEEDLSTADIINGPFVVTPLESRMISFIITPTAKRE